MFCMNSSGNEPNIEHKRLEQFTKNFRTDDKKLFILLKILVIFRLIEV